MPEFFNVVPPTEALDILLRNLRDIVTDKEALPLSQTLGRVTAEEVIANENLPAFPRSAMDGFSVRAKDTFGATEGLPAYLDIIGEVPMGQTPQITVSEGQAARAYTGGMLANGADAVVMIENTLEVDEKTIEVLRPAALGEHVIQVGEDIRVGERVLPNGHKIRPQDLGGLAGLGLTSAIVAKRPRIAIVSTGDELVPPDQAPLPGQIRNINTSIISALVIKAGRVPVVLAIAKDDFGSQRAAALSGLEQADILVFSAGSSVSSRDMTAEIFQSFGNPGVLLHGISHKPGKPTIVAMIKDKPAIGLPGNPVSAFVVFNLLVKPAIHTLMGLDRSTEPLTVQAKLIRDVASIAGREDHVQVSLIYENDSLLADPIFGKSNLVYTLIKADGSITIPMDTGGVYAGQSVPVQLY
jgi:molybdopterin molybdotransferase